MKRKLALGLCVFIGCLSACAAVVPEEWNWTVLLHEDFAGLSPTNLPADWATTFGDETMFMQATNSADFGSDFPGFRFKSNTETVTTPEFVRGTTNILFNARGATNGNSYTVKGLVGADWQQLGVLNITGGLRRTYSLPVSKWRVTRLSVTTSRGFNSASGDVYSFDDLQVQGSLNPCVIFDKPDGFVVLEGTSGSLAAVLVQATDDVAYSWSWTGDLTGEGDLLTIPDSLELGTYFVTATVTGGDLVEDLSATIHFVVEEQPVRYSITCLATNNAVIWTDVETALPGDSVTIMGTPSNQYAIDDVDVWYGPDYENREGVVPIDGNKFVMPATNVYVTATVILPDYLINFENTWPGSTSYRGTNTSFTNSTHPTIQWALTNVLRGTSSSDRRNGAASGRFYKRSDSSGALCQMVNSDPFPGAIESISFKLGQYGENGDVTGIEVFLSKDGVVWSNVAPSNFPTSTWVGCTVGSDQIKTTNFFVKFSAIGSAKQVNVDDIGIELGEPLLRVAISGVTNGEIRAAKELLPLSAMATNGSGSYSYSWEIQRMAMGKGTTETNVTGRTCDISTNDALSGKYKVTVYVDDIASNSNRASDTVEFTMLPRHTVIVSNANGGTITASVTNAFEGDLVQLTITPNTGFQCGEVYVVLVGHTNRLALTDNAFIMPGGDGIVSASFLPDTATLPFNYYGQWLGCFTTGAVFTTLGADYSDSYGDVDGRSGGWARFDSNHSEIRIRFGTAATQLSYYIQSVQVNADFTFEVQASATGIEGSWTTLQPFHKADLSGWNPAQRITNALASDARYARFVYPVASDMGGIAIDGISITSGAEPGAVGLPIEGTLQMTAAGLNFDLPAEAVLPTAVMRATQVTDRRWDGSNILGTAARIADGAVIVSNDVDKAVIWLEY